MGGAVASIPLIGWGKPTPVNPLRWRNKDLANVMVSIAGILANLDMAIIGFIDSEDDTHDKWLGQHSETSQEPIGLFLRDMLIMNISLAVFNLLPFPPLDGSKVSRDVFAGEHAPDDGHVGAVRIHHSDDLDLHGFLQRDHPAGDRGCRLSSLSRQ